MNLRGIKPTTREMLLCVWENFTGVRDGKFARLGRLAGWALLALGITLAAAGYSRLRELHEPESFTSSLPPAALDGDRARLRALSDEMRLASFQRARSVLWVQAMRERESNLFAVPAYPLPAVPELSDLEGVSPPPEIVVKAVMKSGGSWAAVVDIAGAGNGLVMRPGDSFMEGRGKILRLEGDRLIVRWDGREWNAVPGLF